ncbi:hypothetical protein [Bosea lathyri]|uniref:hypothetical protein n=1 Tax=Bosea lathyri TaxID=1036778 RepID=UPI0011B07C02|nr:hypothetical protein [Bosea lathyri]
MVVQVRFDCKNLSELIARQVVHDKFKHQQYFFERPKRKGLRGTSRASAPGGSRGDAAIFLAWAVAFAAPAEVLQELVRIQQN